MSFSAEHAVYLARCEHELRNVAEKYFQQGSTVSEAAEYTLMNGGKRVRGVLTLAVCDLLQGGSKAADSFAAAIEMIHAFSLIHDDLPCMDDDDMRRGKPAAHKVYGEATALLAGDLLSLEAFSVICGAKLDDEFKTAACALLAGQAGAKGMIYGQELDLKYENEPANAEIVLKTYSAKTGALLRVAAQLGVLAAGKMPQNEPAVTTYANNIGLAFQIVDDILDVESSAETLGKPIGSDAQQGKTTYVSLYGVQKSRKDVQKLTDEAIEGITNSYGEERAAFLTSFAKKLQQRIN